LERKVRDSWSGNQQPLDATKLTKTDYFNKEVILMKSSKREAKERNNDLTKTQEVTYKEELKSAESVAETKEMTNEDYS
jgi:hypothetical protein